MRAWGNDRAGQKSVHGYGHKKMGVWGVVGLGGGGMGLEVIDPERGCE